MNLEIDGLQALASKLGVTAEYLWGVLLKQAPISAALDFAFIAFVALLWCVIYRFRKHLDDFNVILFFFGVIIMVVLTVLAVIIVFVAPTALLNPEYWALKQVLSAINK